MIDFYNPIDFEFDGFYKGSQKPQLNQIMESNSNINLNHDWQEIKSIGAGIKNMGNTCYLNSVIQILNYTPCLNNYLQQNKHQKFCQKKNQACALCLFEQNMNNCIKSQKTIQPYQLIENMPKFKKENKQDAYEFFLEFLKAMSQSNDILIKQIFQGEMNSLINCLNCKDQILTKQNFYNINLYNLYNFKNNSNLNFQKALNNFFQKQIIKNFNCNKCKKQSDIDKQSYLEQSPNILIFHLSKVQNNFQNYTYTLDLNIKQYTMNQQDKIYELYGIIIHQGKNQNDGHYYSFIKNSNQLWYKLDDSQVKEISFKLIQMETPYMLFYKIKQNEQIQVQDTLFHKKIYTNNQKQTQLDSIKDIFSKKNKINIQEQNIKINQDKQNKDITKNDLIENKEIVLNDQIINEEIIKNEKVIQKKEITDNNIKKKIKLSEDQSISIKKRQQSDQSQILLKKQNKEKILAWGGSELQTQKQIIDNNKDLFESKKKEKDLYDQDYDKGKIKKVKKPKQKNTNDFQQMYGITPVYQNKKFNKKKSYY